MRRSAGLCRCAVVAAVLYSLTRDLESVKQCRMRLVSQSLIFVACSIRGCLRRENEALYSLKCWSRQGSLDGSCGCNVTDQSDAPRTSRADVGHEEAQAIDDYHNGAAFDIYAKGTADMEV